MSASKIPLKPTTSAASSITTSHAADEAGGEVIFSSDGLDPVPLPPPPTPRFASSMDDDFTLIDDEPLMGIDQAWHTFGHTFKPQSSPAERLQRLEQELQAISQQVATDESLQQQIAQLQSRLAQQWQVMQQQQQQLSVTNASETTAETSSSSVITQDLEQVMLRLERAIGTMSVGSSSTATNTTNTPSSFRNKGLLERVATLEHVVEQLDDRKLEQSVRQAKILRSDLQAASKARSKLQPLGGGGLSSKDATGSNNNYHYDDAKTIALLYNTMVELADVRQHLPGLTQRLHVLAQLHTDTSTYSQRLAAVEETLQILSTQLNSTSQSVASLQTNWNESMQVTMQQNLQALDDRIAKVRAMK